MRTNKATNGVRFKLNEIQKASMLKKNIYCVYAKDSIGDLGLVGAIVVNERVLELFCLSCRAFGRAIEDKMMEFVKDNMNINEMVCKKTGKNSDFLERVNGLIEKK